jgi:hypothetical protein
MPCCYRHSQAAIATLWWRHWHGMDFCCSFGAPGTSLRVTLLPQPVLCAKLRRDHNPDRLSVASGAETPLRSNAPVLLKSVRADGRRREEAVWSRQAGGCSGACTEMCTELPIAQRMRNDAICPLSR